MQQQLKRLEMHLLLKQLRLLRLLLRLHLKLRLRLLRLLRLLRYQPQKLHLLLR
jgi:hypothetical protein